MHGILERRIDVAAGERGNRLQQVRRGIQRLGGMNVRRRWLQRLERVGERFEDLILHLDLRRRLPRMELGVGDDHRQKIRHTTGGLAFRDEDRHVRNRQADSAGTRHVGGGEDADDARHRDCCIGPDFPHHRTGMFRWHHRTVEHAGRAHVVDERFLPERLLVAALARQRRADAISLAVAELGVAVQPEVFAKEVMAPRLVRQLPAVALRLTRGLDRVDDPAIPGAAADVAVERFRDRAAVVGLAVLNQRRGADDDAGDAEAALHARLRARTRRR